MRSPRDLLALLAAASFAAAVYAAAVYAAAPPSSSGPRVESIVFLPPVFGAGEEVEARALLAGADAAGAQPLLLKPGAGLPGETEGADPEIRELRLVRTASAWELRLRFIPWSPGRGQLPGFSLKGFVTPALPYETASRLAPGARDLEPPRPQRDPPGTLIYLYGFAGLVLLILIGIAASAAYLVPAARALLARWRAAQAFKRLCHSLDYLAARAEAAEPGPFYAALTRALRLYLAERVDPRAPALTAAEISALPESDFPAPGLRDQTAGLLAEADKGRYSGTAGLRSSGRAADLRSATSAARSLAAAAEEALDARL